MVVTLSCIFVFLVSGPNLLSHKLACTERCRLRRGETKNTPAAEFMAYGICDFLDFGISGSAGSLLEA
jgi:hypothetical protein